MQVAIYAWLLECYKTSQTRKTWLSHVKLSKRYIRTSYGTWFTILIYIRTIKSINVCIFEKKYNWHFASNALCEFKYSTHDAVCMIKTQIYHKLLNLHLLRIMHKCIKHKSMVCCCLDKVQGKNIDLHPLVQGKIIRKMWISFSKNIFIKYNFIC